MNYTGSFFLDSDGRWVVSCDKPLKVEFGGQDEDFTYRYARPSDEFNATALNYITTGEGYSRSFKTFVIIDEYGTRYTFGGCDDAVEFCVRYYYQATERIFANTWHLTKIEYPDGRSVKLNYERGDFIATFYYYHALYEYKNTKKGDSWVKLGLNGANYSTFDGDLIIPSYLRGITTDEESMAITYGGFPQLEYDYQAMDAVFLRPFIGGNYSAELTFLPFMIYNGEYESRTGYRNYPDCRKSIKWRNIDRVLFRKYGGEDICYKFEFGNKHYQRLALKHVRLLTNYGGEEIGRYSFEYIDKYPQPRYLSRALDRWGYFNGQYDEWGNEEESKNPNFDLASIGTLNKITYPTGGYTQFEYELHDYLKEASDNRSYCITNSSNKLAGGLRIKKIINNPSGEPSDTVEVKKYHYVSGFNKNTQSLLSSGILLQPVKYEGYYSVTSIDKMEFLVHQKQSMSMQPYSMLDNGSHIGYSEVTEENSDGSYTTYRFSNYDEFPDQTAFFSLQPLNIFSNYTSKSMDRGRLIMQTEFDSDGNKVRDTKYTYVTTYPGVIYSGGVVQFNLDRVAFSSTASAITYLGTCYKKHVHRYAPYKITITDFKNNVPVYSRWTVFERDRLGRLLCEYSNVIGDRWELHRYKYPDDFTDSNKTNIYAQMIARNNINTVIEHAQMITEGEDTVRIRTDRYVYDKDGIKPSKWLVSRHGNDFETEAEYVYDAKYNVIQETAPDSVVTHYLWDGKGGRPLAMFENLKSDYMSSVYGLLQGAVDPPEYGLIKEVIGNYKDVHSTFFHYDKYGNLSKIETPSGKSVSYNYDRFSRIVSRKNHIGNIVERWEYNYSKSDKMQNNVTINDENSSIDNNYNAIIDSIQHIGFKYPDINSR